MNIENSTTTKNVLVCIYIFIILFNIIHLSLSSLTYLLSILNLIIKYIKIFNIQLNDIKVNNNRQRDNLTNIGALGSNISIPIFLIISNKTIYFAYICFN